MDQINDWDLLQSYVKEKSEPAFSQLVNRHANWVYSVCLRELRDAHLAEDATQTVFTLLLHKAADLPKGTVIGGWLFRTARFVTSDMRKGEVIRQRHEQAAGEIKARTESATSTASSPLPGAPEAGAGGEDQTMAALNAAMEELAPGEREAIIQKYFLNRSYKEIGGDLKVSENTAAQRVSRAMVKLREVLQKRGVTTVGDLAQGLTATAVTVAPVAVSGLLVQRILAQFQNRSEWLRDHRTLIEGITQTVDGRDVVEEITHQGWLSRIGGSIAGMFIGLLLIVIAFPVLFLNEGRAIHRERSLNQGLHDAVQVTPDSVNSSDAGKLIHITGEAKAPTPAGDAEFHINGDYLRLNRRVEMYQWKESQSTKTQKNLGGSTDTITTYSYSKTWSDSLIDSSRFKEGGHTNPAEMHINQATFDAPVINLGAFKLSPNLITMIPTSSPVAVDPKVLDGLSDDVKKSAKVADGEFYFGTDPGNPLIGDTKVKFLAAEPGTISIMAKQVDSTFEPYPTDAGGSILLLQPGTHSVEDMIQTAKSQNNVLTWVLRVVGFILFFFGFNLVFAPLSILADVIPFIGDVVGGLGAGVAFLLAMVLTFVTIAIGWLFYRPLISIPLLLLAAGAAYFLVKTFLKKRAAKQAQVATA